MNLVSTSLLIISYISVVYTQNLKTGDNCQIERSTQQGICRPVSDCPFVQELLAKRSAFTRCGFDNRITIVCCPVESPETTTSNRPTRISETKCAEYKSAVFYRSEIQHLSLSAGSEKQTTWRNGCGNTAIQLITGGVHANPRQFPHMALIGVTKGSNQATDWMCGGSLISDRFVLTAAHCLIKSPNVIRLGELNYDTTSDEARPEDYRIADVKIHPNYNYPEKYHDIALLKVDRAVQFDIYKRPACLPSSLTPDGTLVAATGWGFTSAFGDLSSSLQKVVLNVVNQNECETTYRRQNITTINEQLCAGSPDERKDACQGDSGGPLQVIHEYEYCMYRIVGVTSFGVTCAVGIPGIYTKVYTYLDWIEQQVWNNASSSSISNPIIFED